ncbi:hypothetical protein [Sphingobium lactosutens]|uniref:hypothetical protein n=1 Tax=Sphingobium lactosutens TaxID=522773 RepID=UPI0012693C59|nr:hypothetical protein [Sphingobium lactosutens]
MKVAVRELLSDYPQSEIDEAVNQDMYFVSNQSLVEPFAVAGYDIRPFIGDPRVDFPLLLEKYIENHRAGMKHPNFVDEELPGKDIIDGPYWIDGRYGIIIRGDVLRAASITPKVTETWQDKVLQALPSERSDTIRR